MRHRIGVAIFATMLLFNGLLGAQPPAQPEFVEPPREGLTPAQIETFTKILIPAYFAGDLPALVETLPSILSSADPEQRKVFDEWCVETGLPDLDEMLAESSYQLAIRGHLTRVRLAPQVTVVVLEYFQSRLAEMEAKFERYPDIDESVPKFEDILEYRDYLWELHVLDNQLSNHATLCDFAMRLARTVPRRARKRLTDQQRGAVETKFNEIGKRLRGYRMALHEAEIVVRVNRLIYAVRALGADLSTKERLLSAYAFAEDGRLLTAFFASKEKEKELLERKRPASKRDEPITMFARKELNANRLSQRIQTYVERGYQNDAVLIEKSVMLFEGLRWWARGRYGRGSEAFGLLKNKAALQSPDSMLAIAMPVVSPTPTMPGSKDTGPIPEYQRRHLHIWSLEDRRFAREVREQTARTSKKVGEREEETEYFF